MSRTADDLREAVRQKYASIAVEADSGAQGAGCGCGCGPITGDGSATLVDYKGEDAAYGAVEGANLGLGCGIPTLSAQIQEGHTVLDLGSGAGVDVFMAARVVGPTGRAIGVDMTPEMILLARANARKGGYENVEFRLGEIEHLPVADSSIDVVISNCVINLVPDKRDAYREIHRVLRPGGCFSISDVVTYGEVPASVREDIISYTGCISGAMDEQEYLALIRKSGFGGLKIEDRREYELFMEEPYGVCGVTLTGLKGD